MSDAVNHPAHYGSGTHEVINCINSWELGFNLGNAVKYIARAGKKGTEKEIEDLKKAEFYLRWEIDRLQRRSIGEPGIEPGPRAP